jgi:8-oxo-dGTP pyrophosphatase MutT (NUDIX family)
MCIAGVPFIQPRRTQVAERSETGRPQPWPVIDEEHKGDFEIFSARAVRARSPEDGSEHTFHVADAPNGVTVIAITAHDELVMVRQWRHPVQRVTLETPSGIIDEGETPEEAAARELREETGYAGDDPECIGCVVLNPSWQTTRVYATVVRNARRAGERDLDEGEDTRVCLLKLSEVRRRVLEGEIDTSSVVAALALWDWRTGATGAGAGG